MDEQQAEYAAAQSRPRHRLRDIPSDMYARFIDRLYCTIMGHSWRVTYRTHTLTFMRCGCGKRRVVR